MNLQELIANLIPMTPEMFLLGALMALLLFVYAVSNVVVFGAEFASEWSRLPADDDEVRRRLRSRPT